VLAALPGRCLALTPEIEAVFGVSAWFRKVFTINKKVCAGPGNGGRLGPLFCKKPAPKTFEVDSKQFGKKVGDHAKDFGLDPSDPTARAQIGDLIKDIGQNPQRSVPGTFRGQGPGGARGPVDFRIKGNDVVVTTPDGKFVTILKDGINNPSVVEALKNAGG